MNPRRRVSAAICGSFTRHLGEVQRVAEALQAAKIRVLSPEQPYPAEWREGFLFVESDSSRLIHHVQERHLQAIRRASFVWLVCTDGYVGTSATLEIGYALATGSDIYSDNLPSDLTLAKFVHLVPNVQTLISHVTSVLPEDVTHHGSHGNLERIMEASEMISKLSDRLSSAGISEGESLQLQTVRRGIALSIAPELQYKMPI